jgi:hypothetical protein
LDKRVSRDWFSIRLREASNNTTNSAHDYAI